MNTPVSKAAEEAANKICEEWPQDGNMSPDDVAAMIQQAIDASQPVPSKDREEQLRNLAAYVEMVTHRTDSQRSLPRVTADSWRLFLADAAHLRALVEWDPGPPALQWTVERPKMAGWYWMRTLTHKNLPFHCYLSAKDIACGLHPDHQHAGPLPLPSEPQAKET